MNRDIVQSWLDKVAQNHSNSEGTRYHYRQALERFCEFLGTTPEQIEDEYAKADAEQNRKLKVKYAQLLEDFTSSLKQKGYARCTINGHETGVKSFFKHRHLELDWIESGRNKITFHNRDIEKSEILAVMNASNIREKAYFCLLAQTGLRPSTACKLKLSDLEPDWSSGKVPCKINVRQEATKGEYSSYFTFVPEESIKLLKQYFITRPNMTKESLLFATVGKREAESDPKTFSSAFARALIALKNKGLINYEKRFDKPSQLRLYTLRKFFRREAGHAGFDYVNFWMGHSLNSVDSHYFTVDIETHRKQFIEKAIPNLRLETSTPTETEKTINELKEQQIFKEQALRERIELQDEKIEELAGLVKELLAERKRPR